MNKDQVLELMLNMINEQYRETSKNLQATEEQIAEYVNSQQVNLKIMLNEIYDLLKDNDLLK